MEAMRHHPRWSAGPVLAVGILLWGSGPSAWAAPGAETQATGTPLVGSLAVTETTAQIMARQKAAALQPQEAARVFFLGRADTSGKTIDPAGEGLVQGPATGPGRPKVVGARGPLAPQAIGVSADGPSSLVNLCGTPPDTMGAVGPTQFIVAVNCNIVTYNKTTGAADGVLNTTPNTFFNVSARSSVSDPHIRYDRISRRWFIVIIDVAFPNNRVLLAVSDTATITRATVWTLLLLPVGERARTPLPGRLPDARASTPTPSTSA